MSMVSEWQHLKIPFDVIEVATENFKTLIGQGGYGWVYKGKLLVSGKETMVAVKRLNEQFGQGLKEFLTEIQLLYGQQHPNLISLVGFCDEGREKCIVYEYAERGSLDQYVRRTRKTTSTTLTWLQRLKICTDAARGLDHLHSHVGAPRMIIHRDIKSSNVLIDENWVAKISDLGLSKLSVSGFGMSEIVSNSCGTRGYCEPEYHTTGIVTKKSDVYSFGVVLFEVLCGRLCLIDSDDGFSLSSISAKKYYKNNTLDKIIDQSLTEHIGSYSMTKFAAIAYRCLHDDRKQRPAMDVVVKELEEALKYQEEDDLDSLIKMFKIPPNKKELLSYLQNLIDFDGGYKGDGSETSGATVGVNGNYNNNGGDGDDFEKDGLLWYKDIGKHYGGEYSMAVVQANQVLEDQSQIESGPFGTFVGVYDGHGGPDAARYVCDNLFRNFQAITAEDHGVVTPNTIKNTYLQTENGFTSLVAELFNERPGIATVGSCCLVGVIYQQTLFVANLGHSRVVLGKNVGNTGGVVAIQLSSEHNANLEEVRHELKNLHPHDPNIVALIHGVWRVKGIIQISRSIGDVYMKHSEYNCDQIAKKFRLPESTVMPILSATPSILTHDINPSDSFLIFASHGLWEFLSNEEAVEIVHNNPRAGIAKRLVKAALHEVARKREMRYSDLRKVDKRWRFHFHDDITVIVLFLNYGQISRGRDGTRTIFDLVHLQKIIQNEERNSFGPGAFRKNRGFLQNLTLRPKISWVSRDTPRPTAANGPNVSLRSALEH